MLGSSRVLSRSAVSLPNELWISCLHTSSSLSRGEWTHGKSINKMGGGSSSSPSRRRLAKDLTPRAKGPRAGKYEVAPDARSSRPRPTDAPSSSRTRDSGSGERSSWASRTRDDRDTRDSRTRDDYDSRARDGRTRDDHDTRTRDDRDSRARDDRNARTRDDRGSRTRDDHITRGARDSSKERSSWNTPRPHMKINVRESHELPSALRLTGNVPTAPATSSNFRYRGARTEAQDGLDDESTRRPKIVNPLSEELDVSPRAQSTSELPTDFTSPPLMEGMLTSLTDVLGPHARPTPIQALSLKHLVANSGAASSTSTREWKQFLLASETGSGKSIAYLLPMLQDLKATELNRSQSSESGLEGANEQPHRALNPRALVLAPTHELSRQLSGFAKSLLHIIKLRVMCASQANAPSVDRRAITASKMSASFDVNDLSESEAIASEFALQKKVRSRPLDVLVGTPSKILEMVRGRGWDWEQRQVEDSWGTNEDEKPKKRRFPVGEPEMGLANVEWVVVDEADVLFDPDFQESTRMLLADISAARGHPVPFKPESVLSDKDFKDAEAPAPLEYPFNLVLTTATIPLSLASYLDTYHPQLTRLASPNLHRLPSTLKTEYCSWTSGNRNADIEQRIRRVWYEDGVQGEGERSKVLIFCNKSARVEDLGKYLTEKGIANIALTSTGDARNRGNNHHLDGFLRQRRREEGTDGASSKSRDAQNDVKVHPHVIITTSLLSRGLDFSPAIKHVFIVDEPRNMIDFLHRAGRSGRAGEKGKVVVFGKTKGRGSSRAKVVRKKVGAMVA